MKILKVELQNINSLKSASPFVVDFKADNFQNVGLFVITGATGSGKTTILDAITVALYHKIPRFTNTKSKLEHIVSYGADTAFATVTFENNKQVYEAQWSIRTVSKTGQLIKPKEEFRLKNLSTEKIIASTKKQVLEAVKEVTQLNYNQFLRSMMLAQGEFSAFLSAPSKDKATLLEQITGEEIYKKIGNNVLRRLTSEKEELVKLNYGLNDEILNEENRKLKETEQANVVNLIKENTKILNTLRSIIDWYVIEDGFTKDRLKIDELKGEYSLSKESYLSDLQLLSGHVLAEPFALDLKEVKRLEISLIGYKSEIVLLKKQAEIQDKTYEGIVGRHEIANQKFKLTENDFNMWLPKLQDVIKLETVLKKENEIKDQLKIDFDKKNEQKSKVLSNQLVLNEKLNEFQNKIEQNNQIISKTGFISGLEHGFAKLSASVSIIEIEENQLLTHKNEIVKNSKFLKESETRLVGVKQELDVIVKAELVLNNTLKPIQLYLAQNSINDLFEAKEKLTGQKNKLEQYNQQLNIYNKKQNQYNDFVIKIDKKNNDLLKYKVELKIIKETVTSCKAMVLDAKELVLLNNRISDLEQEREKLQDGKPCQLCGSTEHPLIDEYKQINISKSEIDLKQREVKLDEVLLEQLNFEKGRSASKTEVMALKQQILTAQDEIKLIEAELNNSRTVLGITKEGTLNLESLEKELKNIDFKIDGYNNNQKQKDKFDVDLKALIESQVRLKNESGVINEKILNQKRQLEIIKLSNKELVNSVSLKVNIVNETLIKYNLNLNDFESYSTLLKNIESKIKAYKSTIEQKQTLSAELNGVHIELKNSKQLLVDITLQIEVISKKIKGNKNLIIQQLLKRELILDASISVETKEQKLKKNLTDSKDFLSKIKLVLDTLKLNKKALSTTIEKTEELILKDKNEHSVKHDLILTKLDNSEFKTIEKLEKSLLSNVECKRIKLIKKEIDTRFIEIKTLSKKLSDSIGNHKLIKNFTQEREVAIDELNLIDKQNKSNQVFLGEINEKLKSDDDAKRKNKEVCDQIFKQEKIVKKWNTLLLLLGGSKDSFNTYVQRLTLAKLIKLANQHLEKLNDRYALKLDKLISDKATDILNFSLVDYYQTNKVRNVETSSGGEKFIISLALALGLSDLSSNNVKIDSLFIDEGFGTLDNETLEVVVSTLETLQQQGKMIGVISHVESLKDRISTQIQISKRSNGVSTLKIV